MTEMRGQPTKITGRKDVQAEERVSTKALRCKYVAWTKKRTKTKVAIAERGYMLDESWKWEGVITEDLTSKPQLETGFFSE